MCTVHSKTLLYNMANVHKARPIRERFANEKSPFALVEYASWITVRRLEFLSIEFRNNAVESIDIARSEYADDAASAENDVKTIK